MQKIVLLICLILSYTILAQANTEVFLLQIDLAENSLEFKDPINISTNAGYDNQPSFLDNNTLLYSSARNHQTDIVSYDINTGTKVWLTTTGQGSEYSPLKIPGNNSVSAIRLDKDGTQLLYKYNLQSGASDVLLDDLKVGYHLWYDKDLLVTTVLVGNSMDLVVANLVDSTLKTYQKNVGRSLQNIPNTDLISYINKESKPWILKSMHPVSGATKDIVALPKGVEDVIWLNDGTLLTAYKNTIAACNPGHSKSWEIIQQFEAAELSQLSRMAIDPNQKYLALVSDTSPEVIVQKQVETFNAGNLDGFVSCYSDDVLVQNFPADTSSVGRKAMRESYRRYMDNNPDSSVEVTRRIVIGNQVIDAETATVMGRKNKQVAIYEVEAGRITSMTFIHERAAMPEAEKIVQQQLNAYNARDIKAFMDTYASDIQLFNFPHTQISEGKDKMRSNYASYFASTPDLNCEIKNRIVIGNKVIDEEFITAKGNSFSAVAIYEVADGKIAKVTFLR